MHTYPTDSPAAISRLLALAMIVDGHLSPLEARTLDKAAFLRQVKVDDDTFDIALRELCEDLLSTAASRCAGIVEIDPALLDGLLREVQDPLLQICLWKAMADIVEADGLIDEREMTLVRRAARAWFGRDQASGHAPVVGALAG
jgi:uncharacterized tellurite resistance protein B-like protein